MVDSPVRRRRHSNELDTARPASIGEEELQLQLALAMSREEHEEQVRRQKSDDIKLQMALDESRRQQEQVRHSCSTGFELSLGVVFCFFMYWGEEGCLLR